MSKPIIPGPNASKIRVWNGRPDDKSKRKSSAGRRKSRREGHAVSVRTHRDGSGTFWFCRLCGTVGDLSAAIAHVVANQHDMTDEPPVKLGQRWRPFDQPPPPVRGEIEKALQRARKEADRHIR